MSDVAQRLYFRNYDGGKVLVGQGWPKQVEPVDPEDYDDGVTQEALDYMVPRLVRRLPGAARDALAAGLRRRVRDGLLGRLRHHGGLVPDRRRGGGRRLLVGVRRQRALLQDRADDRRVARGGDRGRPRRRSTSRRSRAAASPRGARSAPSGGRGTAHEDRRVTATPLAVPFARVFHWRSGVQRGANLVLFEVETDDGVVGVGESICEDPEAVGRTGCAMAEAFVGRSPGDVEAVLGELWRDGRWRFHPAVLAAGPERHRVRVLGRARQGSRRAGLDVPRRPRARRGGRDGVRPGRHRRTELAARRGRARRGGAPGRVRQGRPRRARRRRRVVGAVRDAIGPEPLLRVDANEAWDVPGRRRRDPPARARTASTGSSSRSPRAT